MASKALSPSAKPQTFEVLENIVGQFCNDDVLVQLLHFSEAETKPLPPEEAAARAKESAKEIINVKSLIDKKAWPYVQNDLRLRASYLRYDLYTIISSKSKDEKKSLKELTGKLFDTMELDDEFDHGT